MTFPNPPIAPAGIAPGQALRLNSTGDGWEVFTPQSGSSIPGASVVRHFPFAFNTAGILTGATLYTPTIGDILLDAWIEIDTAWDGTTPFGDVLVGASLGLFATLQAAIDMTQADSPVSGGTFLQGGTLNDLLAGQAVVPTSLANGYRAAPAKFAAADPVKVVVSQSGAVGGANPGRRMVPGCFTSSRRPRPSSTDRRF